MKIIKIGSRGSPLALIQANEIASRLLNERNIGSQIIVIKTKGDKILDTPLYKIGGKGLFSKELEIELLNGNIDLAVHSLKDVPTFIDPNLSLCAITKRLFREDVFVSYKFKDLEHLIRDEEEARIGTTSLRRSMQLKHKYPNLRIDSLRGNITRRFMKLKGEEFHAIILAKAALERLGGGSMVSEGGIPTDIHVAPLPFMIPAMGQGALGLECMANHPMIGDFSALSDPLSHLECSLERDFVRFFEGGCQNPLGVSARLNGDNLSMSAIVGLMDGSRVIQSSFSSPVSELEARFRDFLLFFEQQGAREILRNAFDE